MSVSNVESTASAFPLLRLPLELRRHIYAFALPFATAVPERKIANVRPNHLLPDIDWAAWKNNGNIRYRKGHDVVWTRGCTALLAVSKQVHEEAAAMLYGENTFIIDIKFDAIEFFMRWRTAQELTPNRTYSFLDHFSRRNLLRIRHYIVNVEQVDEYMGMIKYNCGGPGLPAGMRAQVGRLAELMTCGEALQTVEINVWLNDSPGDKAFSSRPPEAERGRQKTRDEAQSRTILAPFECLRGVRKVQMTGVGEQHVEDLRRRITAPKSNPVNIECD